MAKPSLFHNGKFKRLLKVWKIQRAHAVGYLECLWHAQYEAGTAVIGDAEDVELAAEWEGEEGHLVKVLEDCELIDRIDGEPVQFAVHNFFKHMPDYVKKRITRMSQRLDKDLQAKAADERQTNGRKSLTPADNGGQRPPPTQPNPAQANSDAGASGGGGVEPRGVEPPKAAGVSVAKPERKPATGPHHELVRMFCEGWERRYGAKYVFNAGKDGRHIKWLLDAVLHDLAEAQRVVIAYLDDPDQWLIDKAHPLGLLISSFNKYRAGIRPVAKEQSYVNRNPKLNGAGAGGFTGARRSIPDAVADN